MTRFGSWFAVLAVLAGGSAAFADDGPGEPVKLVRTLQLMQDEIAHGTANSENARRTLIDTIADRLFVATPETWRDTRNVDAALLYVLNGGNPAVLDKLPKGAGDDIRTQLIAAIRAYATGSEAEAKTLWAPIGLETLPVGLVGPAALAKATLLMADDPKQAMHFVDVARLQSPGTLIEEAAIRRGIEIAARLSDASRFEFFAIRYATRFPHSMYAEAFRERFSEYYIAIASRPGSAASPSLETILAPLATDDRREMYLEIARLALVDAKVGLAKSAAEGAIALSPEGSIGRRRADLYRSAAEALVGDPASAREQLAIIGRGELPPRDRELLVSVLALIEAIERWPQAGGDKAPLSPDADPTQAAAAPDPGSAIITRANDALQAARPFLSDAAPEGAT